MNAAQWIVSYLHMLRIFGNESVHYKKDKNITPEFIDVNDLNKAASKIDLEPPALDFEILS